MQLDWYKVLGVPPAVVPVSPPSVVADPFYGALDSTVNLAPTQTLYHTNCSYGALGVGDHVFFRPTQADAMLTYKALTTVRGGEVVGAFATYRGGV